MTPAPSLVRNDSESLEPTVSSRRIEDLQDVMTWIAHSDGVMSERRRQQDLFNEQCAREQGESRERLSTLVRELYAKIDANEKKHEKVLESAVTKQEKALQDAAADSKAENDKLRNKLWKVSIGLATLAAGGGYGLTQIPWP